MSKLPLSDPPKNVRQRQLADGTTRIWWEPAAAARRLGFTAVQLDATRLTWSVREAKKLNDELAQALKLGKREARVSSGGRTIEALIDNYTKSSAFKRRAEKTRSSYARQFALILKKWGQSAVGDFTKPVMHTWYEALLEETSEYTAIARLRHMSILFAHAELIGWRAEGSNPCSKLKMAVPKGRRRTATWAEFDALVAAARDLGLLSIQTAMTLSMYQGQRQTDTRLATCGAFSRQEVQLPGWNAPRERWVWRLQRSKRGNEGAMVLHDDAAPVIAHAIEAAKARLRAENPGRIITAEMIEDAPLLGDEQHGGAPYHGSKGEDRFQNRFTAVRDRAIAAARERGQTKFAEALAGLQFRDLRRTFGVNSRAGGASKDDTADVLGNTAATDQFLGDVYMAPSFETASRAVEAVRRPKEQGRKKA
ncbi:hypothetical protein D2T29_00390 [Sinirhodobacter populi]|uniref:Core-binding (CB) domain-containing protein n=1 Tax=Paenirhodobacter populi TaxID=2306993 RepID=A0A443KPY6_9RHOB|nr:hypothetical protein [Sinirhodobacter populi]RWR34969.1 hypothetical protein D2T29_00390 [Sinirhodobacter populi]